MSHILTNGLNGHVLREQHTTIGMSKSVTSYGFETVSFLEFLTYTNKLYSINTDSDGNKPYFLVTVKHKTLGFSAQYKFFIGEEVSKVTPSKTTITF